MKQQHVVVVGGGLIGLCAAHALLRDGHRVTLVERTALGSGAAQGNAGELTPQQVTPLASKNTVLDIMRGVFTRSSYLAISPLQLPHLVGFGLGFLRAASAKRAAAGTAALAQFSGEILPALHRLASSGIDISGGGTGFLMTSSNLSELAQQHADFVARASRGWGEAPGELLGQRQLQELEPTLHPDIQGGFMLPGEFSLDPVSFVASLAANVQAAGAEVRLGLSVERLGAGASVVCRDASGELVTVAGDRVVVAAGAWSTAILRASQVRHAAVVAGKGYSFTVPVETMPQHLLHANDRHCVAIPMHNRLRIVGMMDFDRDPATYKRERAAQLVRAAQALVTGADWDNITDEWVGARPMTADGLPLLGQVPGRPEVLVAAGHNMHGLSLAPVTGEVLADLIAAREVKLSGKPLDLKPFAVNR